MFRSRVDASQTSRSRLTSVRLPDDIAVLYDQRRDEIRRRLSEFAAVEPSHWFYECCFCILTPQSSAVHADAVVRELQEIDFFEKGQDVEHILRNPTVYIRFHRTKHSRLHLLRDQWDAVRGLLEQQGIPSIERRTMLADLVNGYGLKEASHAMRNIGFRGVAILDRHLLRLLVQCEVYPEIPSVSSRSAYLRVEQSVITYAQHVGIDMDELDLLFWCAMTGHILK